MDRHDPRAGGSHSDSQGGQPSRVADRLSRRQALHRLGLGVAGGAVAWTAPEILIGRPTAAGAASEAPQGGGVRPAVSGQSSAGGSVSGADAPTTGQASGATGGAAASPTNTSPGEGGGQQLAFTGFNTERAVELGTGLLVGGWMLTRWSGRRDGNVGDDASAERPPEGS